MSDAKKKLMEACKQFGPQGSMLALMLPMVSDKQAEMILTSAQEALEAYQAGDTQAIHTIAARFGVKPAMVDQAIGLVSRNKLPSVSA